MSLIKHVWFDFSDTLTFLNKDEHNKFRYETYASIVGKPVTPELTEEYETLFKKYTNNANVFVSLGKPSGFWSEQINSQPPERFYRLADPELPKILKGIGEILPVSIFSNITLDTILPALEVDPSLFTHILSSTSLKKPKPAPDGFLKLIELSNVSPENILYIGDSVAKDLAPAKSVGLKTGLMWGTSSEADYSFNSFQEVLNVLQ